MASRRRAREFALQALCCAEAVDLSASGALTALWSTLIEGDGIEGVRPAESEEVEFAQRLAHGVADHRQDLDVLIEECSTNWRVTRMPLVDRNILRIAGFELRESPDIPATVSINEAIELAKRFGGAESRAFVNGLVDRMARQCGRLPSHGRGRGRGRGSGKP